MLSLRHVSLLLMQLVPLLIFIVSPFEAIGKVIGNLIECIGDFLSDPFGAIGNVFRGYHGYYSCAV